MTTPKSFEQIMEEFVDRTYVLDIDHSCCFKKEEEEAWLRSSMASLLCHMAEKMPKEEFGYCDACPGWDDAIDDCRTLLIEEARKISNE